jgi:non-lysosomal glucosylceramidase
MVMEEPILTLRRSCPDGCGCAEPGIDRRRFLQRTGAAISGLMLSRLPVCAGPFEASDFAKLVPPDKRLDPAWVRSLFERGVPTVYRGDELQYIGMPVGGIAAGQVYLGGDGKLWQWDIFNQQASTGDGHYAHPPKPQSAWEQGFALQVIANGKTETRFLDQRGFPDLSFRGEYPIGLVEYRAPNLPVSVQLEAFSPFIPLNPEDSALPATLMQFTVSNSGTQKLECALAGWIENAVCRQSGQPRPITRLLKPAAACTMIEHSVAPLPEAPGQSVRTDLVFEDFEKTTYEGWTVEGSAFGSGPIAKTKLPSYQGDVGALGDRLANSHASAPAQEVGSRDAATGKLTSRWFTIERNYINLMVGGGAHADRTCVNLLVDGKRVLSVTGRNDNRLGARTFDVCPWQGQRAQLEVVDDAAGGWGNIGVDQIVFSDRPALLPTPLAERPDFGTMGLACLGADAQLESLTSLSDESFPDVVFKTPARPPAVAKARNCGALINRFALAPGEQKQVTFAVVWFFPNLRLDPLPPGRYYANRFKSASDVAAYLSANLDRLRQHTRLWRDTWYDSTLPFWLLDRVFANVSILATSTCYWLGNGRFYGWEGVGCCAGTCTHVWHYAQAMARLFPSFERSLRELADFGAGFEPATGRIRFRAEHNDHWAVDGQSGVILRTWREHQMSVDDTFLRRFWPRVKQALVFLIRQDDNDDGILAGAQHNTLDADWYGPIAWLSGMYLAALRAGSAMAREMGDREFAERCHAICERGRRSLMDQLFNGEYFVNQPDPKHLDAINSGTGCHIDQVLGDSWCHQVGLERIADAAKARSALQSLWRYNFTPDVGPWRAANLPGRWYAMAGEGGLLMCTFPKADWNYQKAAGKGPDWAAGYFNECMTGFEYQVAGHMIAEGMLLEGLAITRAVHDRYHAARRNPWNEVECGDHYARAMASYGVYVSACGVEYHGPRGHLGFAPRLSPDNFRAAFTAAEGWGTFSQNDRNGQLAAQIKLAWGRLRLRSLSLGLSRALPKPLVKVSLEGRDLPASLAVSNQRAEIRLASELTLDAGATLNLTLRAS